MKRSGERDAYLDILPFVNNAGKLWRMISVTCLLVAVLAKTSSFTLPLSVRCFKSLVLGTRRESLSLKSTNVLFNVRFLGLAFIIEKIIISISGFKVNVARMCWVFEETIEKVSHCNLLWKRRTFIKIPKRIVRKSYWVSHSIIKSEPRSVDQYTNENVE